MKLARASLLCFGASPVVAEVADSEHHLDDAGQQQQQEQLQKPEQQQKKKKKKVIKGQSSSNLEMELKEQSAGLGARYFQMGMRPSAL